MVEVRKELNYKCEWLIDKQIFYGIILSAKTKITYCRWRGWPFLDRSKIMGSCFVIRFDLSFSDILRKRRLVKRLLTC